MAPDRARTTPVKGRSRRDNFGATMYRLVTLRLPPPAIAEGADFQADPKTRADMLRPVQECNREAPPELCELIHRCLEHNPNRRPERVSELQGVLDHLADDV